MAEMRDERRARCPVLRDVLAVDQVASNNALKVAQTIAMFLHLVNCQISG